MRRFKKFLVCLTITPVIFIILILMAFVMLIMPLAVLINPDIIQLNGE